MLGQATVARLQAALAKVGDFPGTVTMQFDEPTVRAMERYWAASAVRVPCRPSASDIRVALAPLIAESSTDATPTSVRLDFDELLAIGQEYINWKKQHGEYASWLGCYWPWLVGTGAVVATVGYAVYRSQR